MEADSGVTSEERKEDAGDAVDGGSADVTEAAAEADNPSPDTEDSLTPTQEMDAPLDVVNQAIVQQAVVTEDAVAMEEETTALAEETEAMAEVTEQEATTGEEEQAAEGETTKQENGQEEGEDETAEEDAADDGIAGAESEAGEEETVKENAPGEANERSVSRTGEDEEPAKKTAAGETTAREESGTGEGEATDAGETTAEDQEISQIPLIVRVDRRRLNTTPSEGGHPQAHQPSIPGPRLPALRGHAHGQGQGHIQQLPSPPDPDVRGRKGNERLPTRPRLPPKLVRLATVTVSPSSNRPKMAPRGPSLYYETPSKPSKVITWDAAMAARPPLPVDLEGPTPWTYSPRNKPLYETNAPAYSFGRRCQPERDGGSRTAWTKTWFQTPHVWLNKTNFISDDVWPSPAHYRQRGLLGPRQLTVHEAPAFTIGQRKVVSMTKKEKEPAPPDYDRQTADAAVFRRGASFSHQFRLQGTVLWGSMENTPGPAAYSPLTKWRRVAPAGFTIQGTRRQKSSVLGPFATL